MTYVETCFYRLLNVLVYTVCQYTKLNAISIKLQYLMCVHLCCLLPHHPSARLFSVQSFNYLECKYLRTKSSFESSVPSLSQVKSHEYKVKSSLL